MSNINILKFCYFISLFPIWILKSNLSIIEITIVVVFFFLIYLITILFFYKIQNKYIFYLISSLIIIFGIDNILGLWSGLIGAYKYKLLDIFTIIYIPGVLLLIFLSAIIFLLFIKFQEAVYKPIFVFMITIFLFGVIDNTKSYKKIPSYDRSNNNILNNQTLIFILDEMSGINSQESIEEKGSEFKSKSIDFFKKNKFHFYTNSFSRSLNSISSLSGVFNHNDNFDYTRKNFTKPSNNYFVEYDFLTNKTFDRFKNISVHQNIHINYCKHQNVKKCNQYDPFSQNIFLKGFKNSKFSKLISMWQIHGSISGRLIWRLFRQLRFTDSSLEPEGQKASFNSLLEKVENDISSKKFDLVFVHPLVPHRPYGLDHNCNYDGSLANLNIYFDKNKKITQHNIERLCMISFLENFLSKLKKNNLFNNLNIILFSDHDGRIIRPKTNEENPIIFAFKKKNSKVFIEDKRKIDLVSIFEKHLLDIK